MGLLGTYQKQPAEVVDYDVDYSDYLPVSDLIDTEADGYTPRSATVLISSTTEAVPALERGVIKVIDSGKTLKVWLFGGTDGGIYKVTVRITSIGGRVKEVEFKVRVRDV